MNRFVAHSSLKHMISGSFWISGAVLIATSVAFLYGVFHLLESFFEWMTIRRLIKGGRCISWEGAAEKCRAKEGFLIIERRRMPRKVWFVEGTSAEVLSPVSSIRAKNGFIVKHPPRLDDDFVKTAEFGQRVVEINFSGIMYVHGP